MSRRYGYRRPGNAGLERARQHIQDAENLSRELGGTDQDVKNYFFSLNACQRRPIFDKYEATYGPERRQYAEFAFPLWKSGTRRMSGTVAERLFNLLPDFMPIKVKFDLVKNLWHSQCPLETCELYIGPDANPESVCRIVEANLRSMVKSYTISDTIRKRFQWLARKDSRLQEQLSNFFMQQRREILSEALHKRVPALISQINSSGINSGISQTIPIGNYKLRLQFNQKAEGISSNPPKQKQPYTGCLAAVLTIIAMFTLACFLS